MTEHVHTAACYATGAICGGMGRVYFVYSHITGRQSYDRVGKKKFRSAKAAMKLAVETLMENRIYNRVAVAFVDPYYDPSFIYEIKRS